ncbi:PREDICTED: uncharacterized protein LOC108972588 [Bactrocera latifrons]|uniref:Uncharacterized protein n=1 Tax=Bactrocera latifrons TaxID=174628 RepID=A0A0K8WAH2_BACLA|nr:PREDICTED: uncharacterized protein LOC108972588 [Bactrocera latifrons]
MCKFTNRLFVFTLLELLALGTLNAPVNAAAMRAQHRSAADPKFLDLLSLNEDNNNYDLHYDQRQKGEENLHVRMNGFFIEMPDAEDTDVSDELKELLYYAILLGGSEEMFKHLVENKISTTPTPASLTLSDFGLLNKNQLDSERHAIGQQREDPEAATKHKVEGRNANPLQGSSLVAVNREPESKRVGLITKQHFNTLLSLLKRMRRN